MRRFACHVTSVLALSGAVAVAQSTIGVDPNIKIFDGAPGQTITQELHVWNPNMGGGKLRVTAYMMDFDFNDLGQLSYPAAGTLKSSMAPWLSVSPNVFELDPKGTQNVRYSIKIPADAAPGTHWGMLMFDVEDLSSVQNKSVASIQIRIGHGIYVNIPPLKRSGEVTGIFDQPPATPSDAYRLGVQFSNTGNQVIGLGGHIEIRDGQGTTVASQDLKVKASLPGKTTLLPVEILGPFKKGQYSVLAVLNTGVAGAPDILGETVINMPFDLLDPSAATVPAAPAAGTSTAGTSSAGSSTAATSTPASGTAGTSTTGGQR